MSEFWYFSWLSWFQPNISHDVLCIQIKQGDSKKKTNTHTHTHTHTHYGCCAVLSCFSFVRLFMTLWTVSHQPSLSIGFYRQEYWSGLPFPFPQGALVVKIACQSKRQKRSKFSPRVRKISWWGAWPPTPVFLPGEPHGQRSLEGYTP